MTESQAGAKERTRRPRRWRYLIDIIVLVAVTFVLDAVLGVFIPAPINWERGFVFDAIGKNAAGRSCVGIDSVARRDIGRHRAEAAGELDAHVHDRHWAGRNCFHRHVSF